MKSHWAASIIRILPFIILLPACVTTTQYAEMERKMENQLIGDWRVVKAKQVASGCSLIPEAVVGRLLRLDRNGSFRFYDERSLIDRNGWWSVYAEWDEEECVYEKHLIMQLNSAKEDPELAASPIWTRRSKLGLHLNHNGHRHRVTLVKVSP